MSRRLPIDGATLRRSITSLAVVGALIPAAAIAAPRASDTATAATVTSTAATVSTTPDRGTVTDATSLGTHHDGQLVAVIDAVAPRAARTATSRSGTASLVSPIPAESERAAINRAERRAAEAARAAAARQAARQQAAEKKAAEAKAAAEAAAAAVEEAKAKAEAEAAARANQSGAVFATVAGQELVLPGAVAGVGFHESGDSRALPMQPVGRSVGNHNAARVTTPPDGDDAVRYFVLPTRGRVHAGTTAVDIRVKPDVPVTAPVTGTVDKVEFYALYGRHRDVVLEIIPDDNPNLRVRVLHIRDVGIQTGARVTAGETVIAERSRQLPFPSQIDRFSGAGPHLHLEVHANERPVAEADAADETAAEVAETNAEVNAAAHANAVANARSNANAKD